MPPHSSRLGESPLGQAWLHQELALRVPPAATESRLVAGARRTETDGERTLESYPRRYATDGSVVGHLRFALRHEPLDLGVLTAAFREIGPKTIESWVRAEPTGAFSRRAWFLYETLLGRILDLEDGKAGNYVAALDPARHFVAAPRRSRRHRVADNLLGGPGLCPTVRRTRRLVAAMEQGLDDEARTLVARYEPSVLIRAVNYLYTKETHSSFAIEGETPSTTRAERFVAALRTAPGRDPTDKAALLDLQAGIVDPRYAAADWRDVQIFVGSTVGGYREEVHFIGPRPDDVPKLMEGWAVLARRLAESAVDPVVAAAVSSFAFVFVHPFEDGNGRIHRWLLHHALASRGYGPEGAIFPVSAAILRDRPGYDAVLESFSRPRLHLTPWDWTPDREVRVEGDTADLYRFFDATAFAEYLYDRIAETIRRDLRDELGFVAVFTRASEAAREIVDMPDRRLSLFVRLVMQNQGRLSAAKRGLFEELSDAEIAAMEQAVASAREEETGTVALLPPVDGD